MRQQLYSSRHIPVARLLRILRDLDAHPGLTSTVLAQHASISLSSLQRLLAGAERDLGVVIGAIRNPGGMWIEDWGLFDPHRVLGHPPAALEKPILKPRRYEDENGS